MGSHNINSLNKEKAMNSISPFNFDPFFSRTIGFDRIFDRLNQIAEENIHTPSYPPYNLSLIHI